MCRSLSLHDQNLVWFSYTSVRPGSKRTGKANWGKPPKRQSTRTKMCLAQGLHRGTQGERGKKKKKVARNRKTVAIASSSALRIFSNMGWRRHGGRPWAWRFYQCSPELAPVTHPTNCLSWGSHPPLQSHRQELSWGSKKILPSTCLDLCAQATSLSQNF